MTLPNGDRAVVDVAKLRDYCLSLEHPRGRHKARVFSASLGLTAADAEWLRLRLQTAAANEQAIESAEDSFGKRYEIDLSIQFKSRSAMIRSCWIIRHDEEFPRLTTCFVL